MATESFNQDLVIDTPEAAAAFIDMYNNDRCYTGPRHPVPWATDEQRKALVEERKSLSLYQTISGHGREGR